MRMVNIFSKSADAQKEYIIITSATPTNHKIQKCCDNSPDNVQYMKFSRLTNQYYTSCKKILISINVHF